MKYNLTNETFLPETMSEFPDATEMTFFNMIAVSAFYNIIPLVISFATYYPIVILSKKLFKTTNLLSLLSTGLFLTLTTPIIYFIVNQSYNYEYNLKISEVIAWSLCFISSIIIYYLLNKTSIKSSIVDTTLIKK